MNINELERHLASIGEEMIEDCADILAETATEYFKDTFRQKAFDGNAWVAARTPKRRGSLLIDSGAMMNSIRPIEVSRERVVIAAGNDKVTYARSHNEGFDGLQTIEAHQRRTPKGRTATVKKHTRMAHIPQRQFMGDSQELNGQIIDRIKGFIQSL